MQTTSRRTLLAGAAALPALAMPALAGKPKITLDDFRQAYAKLDPNAQAFLRALANEHAEVEIAAAGVDPIFDAIERHGIARAIFWTGAPMTDDTVMDARSNDHEQALADLLTTRPTTVAGCVAVLRHMDHHLAEYEDEESQLLGNASDPVASAGAGFLASIAAALTTDKADRRAMPASCPQIDSDLTSAACEIEMLDFAIDGLHAKFGDDADSRADYLNAAARRQELIGLICEQHARSWDGIWAKATVLRLRSIQESYAVTGKVAESLSIDIMQLSAPVAA
jgi:hypothetical protein